MQFGASAARGGPDKTTAVSWEDKGGGRWMKNEKQESRRASEDTNVSAGKERSAPRATIALMIKENDNGGFFIS